MFKIKNLSYTYIDDKTEFHALRGVDLTINQSEFVTLSGPSGSGKSTLLNLLGLIDISPSNSIFYEGRDLSLIQETEKNRIRRYDFSFIFQQFHLFPVLSAFENVEYFLIKQGMDSKERKLRVEWALESLGLKDHMSKFPNQLSGGQRQRVAVARALAKKPKVIIADEPTASLDRENGEKIINYLRKINSEEQVAIIMASHDPMVLSNSPRIVKLQDGMVIS